MFTYYQVYILHLLDGTKIELAEEYDIPEEKRVYRVVFKSSP